MYRYTDGERHGLSLPGTHAQEGSFVSTGPTLSPLGKDGEIKTLKYRGPPRTIPALRPRTHDFPPKPQHSETRKPKRPPCGEPRCCPIRLDEPSISPRRNDDHDDNEHRDVGQHSGPLAGRRDARYDRRSDPVCRMRAYHVRRVPANLHAHETPGDLWRGGCVHDRGSSAGDRGGDSYRNGYVSSMEPACEGYPKLIQIALQRRNTDWGDTLGCSPRRTTYHT